MLPCGRSLKSGQGSSRNVCRSSSLDRIAIVEGKVGSLSYLTMMPQLWSQHCCAGKVAVCPRWLVSLSMRPVGLLDGTATEPEWVGETGVINI